MVSPTPSLSQCNNDRFHGFVVLWFHGFVVSWFCHPQKNLSIFFWPESKFLKSCVILRKARDSRIVACCVRAPSLCTQCSVCTKCETATVTLGTVGINRGCERG